MVIKEGGDKALFPGIVIEVQTPAAWHRFLETDLVENPGSGNLETPGFSVPESGPIEVSVALSIRDLEIASGSVTFQLREDFQWGVGIFRTNSGIDEGCISCFGQEIFPIGSWRTV